MSSLEEINIKARSFVVFKQLFQDDVMKAFTEMIDFKEKSLGDKIQNYSNFASELFKRNENFTDYIWQLIIKDENLYVHKRAKKEEVSHMLKECVRHELEALQEISKISSKDIKKKLDMIYFCQSGKLT
jgi:uncharacterized protein